MTSASALGGGGVTPKSRPNEQNQLISVCNKLKRVESLKILQKSYVPAPKGRRALAFLKGTDRCLDSEGDTIK